MFHEVRVETLVAIVAGIVAHHIFRRGDKRRPLAWSVSASVICFISGFFIPPVLFETIFSNIQSNRAMEGVTFLLTLFGGAFLSKSFSFVQESSLSELISSVLKKLLK